jgi:hypothetical protein
MARLERFASAAVGGKLQRPNVLASACGFAYDPQRPRSVGS